MMEPVCVLVTRSGILIGRRIGFAQSAMRYSLSSTLRAYSSSTFPLASRPALNFYRSLRPSPSFLSSPPSLHFRRTFSSESKETDTAKISSSSPPSPPSAPRDIGSWFDRASNLFYAIGFVLLGVGMIVGYYMDNKHLEWKKEKREEWKAAGRSVRDKINEKLGRKEKEGTQSPEATVTGRTEEEQSSSKKELLVGTAKEEATAKWNEVKEKLRRRGKQGQAEGQEEGKK